MLHIVLYQPEIPQNTGAVGRTCVAVGAKLWLVQPLGIRIDEKRLRRAGLDYWQHLEWQIVAGWDELTEHLPEERMWFFTKTAQNSVYDTVVKLGDALVFGCETQGLPPSLLHAHPHRTVRIPTSPNVRSLNLSCAVAVAAYESLRQSL